MREQLTVFVLAVITFLAGISCLIGKLHEGAYEKEVRTNGISIADLDACIKHSRYTRRDVIESGALLSRCKQFVSGEKDPIMQKRVTESDGGDFIQPWQYR